MTKDKDPKRRKSTLGSNLRKQRESQGVSLTQLAAACGTSPSHISCIELGKTSPTIDTVERICEALGVLMDLPSGDLTPIVTDDENGAATPPVEEAKPVMRKKAKKQVSTVTT